MVLEASGCWASEVSAVATALPSASAGPRLPKRDGDAGDDDGCHRDNRHAVHGVSFGARRLVQLDAGLGLRAARGGRDVDRGQDAEDVGLHHAGQQTERRHDDRKDEGRDGEQNADDHRPAHHVAEQADGQGQRAGEFADDIERQHDEGRLDVGLEVAAQPLLLDAEERHGHEHAERERRGGRERARRRLVAGNDGAEAGRGEEQRTVCPESRDTSPAGAGRPLRFVSRCW